ncbi:interferon-induced GTP-binding protein Mx1 [Nannospalax galili]|uniref:interferon-induced GTP-binding protein Mx1 n=1 Tax=Nannospalax galili TaxID=1026970 RepID=UPI00111C212E|nr:interferon-induced GTP-binding protein Mx1 [Nannospalax galili]
MNSPPRKVRKNSLTSKPDHLLQIKRPNTAEESQGTENNLCRQYEEKVRPCIDLIDSLRALGVEQDLALPAIAVIGDQSSGKSSVLEALSGVALPRGSGIVTRCPLELKLKKLREGKEWRGKVTYGIFEVELSDPSQVEGEINKAQNHIAGEGLGISSELISLEVSSPHVPDLTLIDLPGITRVAVGNQPADIGHQIKRLIRKYIQKQETINLVVVPSNVDIATTEALSMAQEVDPEGDRTIGILTKPDLVDRGAEDKVVDVVRNLVCHLKKGYMVVRCRGQQDIQDQLSLAEALRREQAFFKEHPHFSRKRCLNKSVSLIQKEQSLGGSSRNMCRGRVVGLCVQDGCVGTPAGNGMLLMGCSAPGKSAEKSLPRLENQIKESHQRASDELQKYGVDVPEDDSERTFFLIEKINTFNKDITALVQAQETVSQGGSRLFSKLRDQFFKWNTDIEKHFKNSSDEIHRHIQVFENQERGRELPGFVNFKTFENIIRKQIKALEQPAVDMLHVITDMVRNAFTNASSNNFNDFFNLHSAAKSKIEDIRSEQEREAERSIRLHFQMEQIVYCQDQVYKEVLQQVREKDAKAKEDNKNRMSFVHVFPSAPPPQDLSISEMIQHQNTYYQESRRSIGRYVPLIIQYFVLQMFGEKLEKAMLQLLQDKEACSWLLAECSDTREKRKFLKRRLARLAQAQHQLAKFPNESGFPSCLV